MTACKRNDGRKCNEMREISAKVGIVPTAKGSAMFKIGNTIAMATVQGPRELYPSFLQNPEKGILRCNYNMMAFSGSGDRVRPGPNRRSKEISMITKYALEPVLDLKAFPGGVVDVFIELLQTDAGTRCAGICAAALALADAGIPMKDMISALSIGILDGEILMDINGYEDCDAGATDIPFAIANRTGELTLLQADGLFTKEQLLEATKLAIEGCKKIHEVQIAALKAKYAGEAK